MDSYTKNALAGGIMGIIIGLLIVFLTFLIIGCSDPPPDKGIPWPTGSTNVATLTIRPAYSGAASAKPTIVDAASLRSPTEGMATIECYRIR